LLLKQPVSFDLNHGPPDFQKNSAAIEGVMQANDPGSPKLPDCTPFRFSTADLPKRDRLTIFREVIGRATLKLDLAPLADRPFQADLVAQALPGLVIVSGASANVRAARTRELLDDSDDLILKIFTSGIGVASQRGQEVTLRAGDALLMSAAETSVSATSSLSGFITLPLKLKAVASLVSSPEDALMRLLPGTDALRLLAGYVKELQDSTQLTTYELQRAVVTHVYDLAALAIGATLDGTALAGSRGLRAAQLAAIKADINTHLADPDLTLTAVAARQRLRPRSLQGLFADHSTSFSEFVLEARLTLAHRLLSDPRWDDRNISSIAFEAGFGDLSYFNRGFRRRYGAKPSDIRAATAVPKYNSVAQTSGLSHRDK